MSHVSTITVSLGFCSKNYIDVIIHMIHTHTHTHFSVFLFLILIGTYRLYKKKTIICNVSHNIISSPYSGHYIFAVCIQLVYWGWWWCKKISTKFKPTHPPSSYFLPTKYLNWIQDLKKTHNGKALYLNKHAHATVNVKKSQFSAFHMLRTIPIHNQCAFLRFLLRYEKLRKSL